MTTPHSMQDLSSLTRNWTWTPCIGSAALTAGSPWKSQPLFFFLTTSQLNWREVWSTTNTHRTSCSIQENIPPPKKKTKTERKKKSTEFLKFLLGPLPDSPPRCLTCFNFSQGSPWVCADLLGYSHGYFWEKQSQEELYSLPWLAPSANSCFIKCWFRLWSWVNGGGEKSHSQNKEPFRCRIENIKVTESFCPQPHRPSSIWMKGRGCSTSTQLNYSQRPSEREKTYYSQPPPLGSLRFFPRGEFLAFCPISLKNVSFT